MVVKAAAVVLFIACCLSASTMTGITVTGVQNTGVQWDTPVGAPDSDVWRQIDESTFGAYADNLLTVNPGDSGTLMLRFEGFGGFQSPALGSNTDYSLQVIHGSDTLTIKCTVSGATCSGTGSDSANGLTILDFNMAEVESDIVAAFAKDQDGNDIVSATGPLPLGTGPNYGADIVAAFDYTMAVPDYTTAIPEPSTMGLLVAGLAILATARRSAS